MNGNNPRPPVKLVRKWTKQTAPLPISSLPTLPSAGHSNTPVTLSLPPVSTQVPLRAPKKTQYQKIDDFICTNGFPTLGDFLMALFQHRVRGEKDHRTRRHRQASDALGGTPAIPRCHGGCRRVEGNDNREAVVAERGSPIIGGAVNYRLGLIMQGHLVYYVIAIFVPQYGRPEG
ncbi:hypothetical protein B0H17DRAFT_1130231 [Mycena rosella]|uniref:Uncharacterized protein n=1 Tax=Mycena rosella TaxID=1033263 RepID=A0AAD7DQV7_MYCRO|nr:hypothetical protein B0H17DRAFT_1130231 [Mycena rosella]